MPPKVHARDIVAYSDAELDRYLDQRRFGGPIVVDVEDPENLPESFISGYGTATHLILSPFASI